MCRCDTARGFTCAPHQSIPAIDASELAEWYAMAESEAPEREPEGSHWCRVPAAAAASLQAHGGDGGLLSVAYDADGTALVEYEPIGESRAVSEVSLVPIGLLSTDAEMRRVQADRSHWSHFDWRDRMCGRHGNPKPGRCEDCHEHRAQTSRANLAKANRAKLAKRMGTAYVDARTAASDATRERIGVLPLD